MGRVDTCQRISIAFAGLLLLTPPAAASAQSVQGRILDAAADEAIQGAEVRLHDAAGRVVGRTLSDAQGRFFLLAPSAGEFALWAGFVGYPPMEPVSLLLDAEEIVELELRLARTAVELEPVTVTARRPDVHHDATFEGALARHRRFPPIGSRRVILPDEVELRSAVRVSDVLRFLQPPPPPPPLVRVYGGTDRCLIVYVNGTLILSKEAVSQALESATVSVDAVEYYRSHLDAPLGFRDVPPYLWGDPKNCGVMALWVHQVPDPRRGGNPAGFAVGVVVALLLFVVTR